jgi:hypothetical protein
MNGRTTQQPRGRERGSQNRPGLGITDDLVVVIPGVKEAVDVTNSEENVVGAADKKDWG